MEKNKSPQVTIVVPVYNGAKTIGSCLDSLLVLEHPSLDIEIIVVDNNSTDQTKEIVQRYPFLYVFEPKMGRAAARNRGIRESRGEFIAFLDADCLIEKSWLIWLLEGLDDPAVGACAGPALALRQDTPVEKYCVLRGVSSSNGLYQKGRDLPIVVTRNSCFRRSALEEIGLFDEVFFDNDDTDLSLRLILSGYQLNYAPKAGVAHYFPSNLEALLLRSFEYGHSLSYLIRKYRDVFGFSFFSQASFLFLRIPANIFILVFSLIRGKDKMRNSLFDLMTRTAQFSGMLYGRWQIMLKKVNIKCLSRQKKTAILLRTGGSLKIVRARSREKYEFNPTGTKLLSALLKNFSVSVIIREFAEEHGIPDHEARNQVEEFIKSLAREGLLSYKEGKPPVFNFKVR